jgi:hypothetical protein
MEHKNRIQDDNDRINPDRDEGHHAEQSGHSSGHSRTVKTVMALALGLFVATLIFSTNIVRGLITHMHPESTHNHPERQVESKEVYVIAEVMPDLIGGLSSIQEQVHYPELAKKSGIEGRVFLQFVVDENGRVVDPIVTRGIGAGCDEAALAA